MSYIIRYANGDIDGGYDSTQDCLDRIELRYRNYYAGHDGDLSEGGDRTLVWANEPDSENDDGYRAIASIVRE
jgi:hypothetical protein